MIKTIIICDKCHKEIDGRPARVSFYDVTPDEDVDQTLYEPGQDYCTDCVMEMIALVDNFKPEEKKPEETVKKQKKKAAPKKKTDVGKIWALRDAGWKMKDIALDANCSVTTVSRVLQQERPVPEYIKEEAVYE